MNFETLKNERSATIVVGVERLNAANAPELKSELVLLNNQGINNIIIDLSATQYCDSSGLSALLLGNRLCKDSSGKFILCGIGENVGKLIAIAQLDKVLLLEKTRTEAEASLAK